MAEDDSKSLDIFGLKPYADSVKVVTQAAVDGAAAFLSRICLPAAEEFGLLLKDKVSLWRAANTVSIVAKAESKLNSLPNAERKHAHPRLIAAVIEYGSWIDDNKIQEMWAGLLASSCTEGDLDDSNLLFINLLAQMTRPQAYILSYVCEKADKGVSETGFISTFDNIAIILPELQRITDVSDVYRLDREMDYLCTIGLINGGFNLDSTTAYIHPTPLAFHLYVRCQGYIGSPTEYFGLTKEVDGKTP